MGQLRLELPQAGHLPGRHGQCGGRVSIVLLTEYFDIKGANILRLGYMTTLIYSGVALVTGYLFLYASDGILTTGSSTTFPSFDPELVLGLQRGAVHHDLRLHEQPRAVPAQRHPRH